jgi:hypothetical protein
MSPPHSCGFDCSHLYPARLWPHGLGVSLLISKLAAVYSSGCLLAKVLQNKRASTKPERYINRVTLNHYTPYYPTVQAYHALDVRSEGHLCLAGLSGALVFSSAPSVPNALGVKLRLTATEPRPRPHLRRPDVSFNSWLDRPRTNAV